QAPAAPRSPHRRARISPGSPPMRSRQPPSPWKKSSSRWAAPDPPAGRQVSLPPVRLARPHRAAPLPRRGPFCAALVKTDLDRSPTPCRAKFGRQSSGGGRSGAADFTAFPARQIASALRIFASRHKEILISPSQRDSAFRHLAVNGFRRVHPLTGKNEVGNGK